MVNVQQNGYIIKSLNDEQDKEKWNCFVSKCENAGFFHQAQWADILKKAFGHQAYYRYAEKNGEVKAILPLVHVKSRLFGSFLSSTPFCIYGGPAYIDSKAAFELVNQAILLGRSLAVDYIELRTETAFFDSDDYYIKDLYSTFRMPLEPDRDLIIKAIRGKQRNIIRKSFKMGLESTFDQDITDFFEIYSTSVRNLGTPVFSKRFFKILLETFGDQCEILTIRKDGRPVSTAMSFYNNKTVYPYYVGGNLEARDLKSNCNMFYELMCHAAINRGCTRYDFGRSKKGTGAWKYKKNWAIEPKDLQYQYILINAPKLPDLSPNNKKYQLMIQLWKRLPLRVSQILGPYISKYLG